ncbi:MAG: hypothetical protein M0P57_14285 [Syntrophales bacterium]|nr:hypothetical protein [Syntrophales bacterium]
MRKKTVDIDTYEIANRLHKIDSLAVMLELDVIDGGEKEALERLKGAKVSNVISNIARYIQNEVAAALEILP